VIFPVCRLPSDHYPVYISTYHNVTAHVNGSILSGHVVSTAPLIDVMCDQDIYQFYPFEHTNMVYCDVTREHPVQPCGHSVQSTYTKTESFLLIDTTTNGDGTVTVTTARCVDTADNCQICVPTICNTVHCNYDRSVVQAHNILHSIQLHCGGMRLYSHHVAYAPWRLVEQRINKSTLKVSSLDLGDLRNYVVVNCKGIFSIALEHKYGYIVESKSRRATSRYMLYPKSQITSTDVLGIKSMRVGFMENNTLHVCDYFALVDGVPVHVEGTGDEFDCRSSHFHLDGLVSIPEGNKHWRQIRFGGGSGVRIWNFWLYRNVQ
jgi:hypothetical protein